MNKYIVEAIGTFFLVFTVCVAAVFGMAGELAPVAIGSVLGIMIYAGGHISGGHFNPAVTFAAAIRGKCAKLDVAPYWIAQVVAGVLAVFAARAVAGDQTIEAANLAGKTVPIVLGEALFTFALAWTVLNTATAKATAGNSNYGLCIGGVVMVGAFTVGGITLGVFNPAVAVALVVAGKLPAPLLGLYVVVQLAAGALAALAFKGLAGDQD